MPVQCNVTNSIILYTYYKFSVINVSLFTINLVIKITHLKNILLQILRQSFVGSLGSYLPNKNSHAGKQFLQFRKYRCHIVQARINISNSHKNIFDVKICAKYIFSYVILYKKKDFKRVKVAKFTHS